MKKILPVILALLGLGAGIGAGLVLRPDPAAEAQAPECAPPGPEPDAGGAETAPPPPDQAEQTGAGSTFVKLNNQFVVPVMQEGKVVSLVVLSLSLELADSGPERVYKMEPKLRDAFLQVLFDHANTGGFSGSFTSGRKMQQLRGALRETARAVLGPEVKDILIVDIVRQDA